VKLVWLFFKALPDLIKLLVALQTAIEKAEVDRHVTSDLKALTGAVNAKDASAINHIFNS
jgi:hypothetical protein